MEHVDIDQNELPDSKNMTPIQYVASCWALLKPYANKITSLTIEQQIKELPLYLTKLKKLSRLELSGIDQEALFSDIRQLPMVRMVLLNGTRLTDPTSLR